MDLPNQRYNGRAKSFHLATLSLKIQNMEREYTLGDYMTILYERENVRTEKSVPPSPEEIGNFEIYRVFRLFSRTFILSLVMGAGILQAKAQKRGHTCNRIFCTLGAVGLVQFRKILN